MKTSTFFLAAAMMATPAHAGSTVDAAIGGGLGGAAGAAIGNEMGGRKGAVIGGAIGGAVGAAVTTRPEPRTEPAPSHPRVRYPYRPAPSHGFCPPGQAKKGRC